MDGQITLPICYKNRRVDVKFYVRIDQKPLLSGKASKQLGLIERIHMMTDIKDMYPELETTTGTLPGTYLIKIDLTIPPVVHGPRRQPQSLHKQIVDKVILRK